VSFERTLRAIEHALVALGLAVLLLVGAVWLNWEAIGAWYRELPVVIAAAHCPRPSASIWP
jgi:hypothetical protein